MKQITEKQQIKVNATKSQFYEKINKIHKSLVSLIKKKEFHRLSISGIEGRASLVKRTVKITLYQ